LQSIQVVRNVIPATTVPAFGEPAHDRCLWRSARELLMRVREAGFALPPLCGPGFLF
jgi:hypothetical protein